MGRVMNKKDNRDPILPRDLGSEVIIICCPNKTDPTLFHWPKALPAHLALFHTLPSHPLSLLGLGNGLYTPYPLLLLSHLVDYQLPSLSWACLVPFRSYTEPKPPLPCTCPTISPIWRAAFASTTDFFADHF